MKKPNVGTCSSGKTSPQQIGFRLQRRSGGISGKSEQTRIKLNIGPDTDNIVRANRALQEFGIPFLIAPHDPDQIIQIGMAPDRIDLMVTIPGVRFETAWKRRTIDNYGSVATNWMDIDSLIRAKRGIDNPRHQEDVLQHRTPRGSLYSQSQSVLDISS